MLMMGALIANVVNEPIDTIRIDGEIGVANLPTEICVLIAL